MVKNDRRGAYYRALLSENRMLVDYIAANATKDIWEIRLKDTRSPCQEMTTSEILSRLDEISSMLAHPPEAAAGRTIAPQDTAFLQITRDVLNEFVRPASSLTVAYTALVTGSRRSEHSESRETLARDAYGGLISTAYWHRITQRGFLVLAMLITLLAVRESSNVALGRDYMRNLANLQVQQASIAAEKARLEGVLAKPVDEPDQLVDKTDPHRLVLSAFMLCDRKYALADYFKQKNIEIPEHPIQVGHTEPVALQQPIVMQTMQIPQALQIDSSEQERDVCGRDFVLAADFSIAHKELRDYIASWPEMMGPFAMVIAWVKGDKNARLGTKGDRNQDIEFIIGPALTVWGNYILPVIFGLLGTLVFVILDFYGKVRDSRLDPRDNSLCVIRLVLGLVTGSCIGLFYSATAPADASPSQSVGAALSLSASGIAFLAGFGVEGVFNMLQELVTRVFVAQKRKNSSHFSRYL
jgi:hypothetical protein